MNSNSHQLPLIMACRASRKHILKQLAPGLCGALLTGVALSFSMPATAQDIEPIVAVGHGAFFDHSGKQIPLTLDHADAMQRWYGDVLFAALSQEDQAEFKKQEDQLFEGLDAARQDRMILRHQAFEWALARHRDKTGIARTAIKLRALRAAMDWPLPEKASLKVVDKKSAHKIAPDVLDRLERFKLAARDDIQVFKATLNKGQAYLDECRDAGVPIPPSINQMDPTGLTGWRSEGFIPQAEQFIVGTPAELRSYRSTMPAGMCYALPRYTDASLSTVFLDGVICMGERTSNVCFWDNQWTPDPVSGTVTAFTIAAGEIVPIGVPDAPGGKYQAGGAEIEFGPGDVCTDCHAGENPYIVHPKSILRGTTKWEDIHAPGGDLDHFAVNRYVPLVGPSWPQNEASHLATAGIPAVCNGCHVKTSAGRFPHLSEDIPGYCFTVLRQAGQRTMPPSSPGTSLAAVNSWIDDYCYDPPNADVADVGDPHITTVDGTHYDFQAAGEFTMLKNSDGSFEVQTRQTPVLTSFVPGPNPYTGLASCASLNTAVALKAGKVTISYQPAGGALSSQKDLELYVDGTVVAAGVYDLGDGNSLHYAGPGNGVSVALADGSKVRIDPHYWSDQGYWYLDLHIDDTSARQGVMGPIAGNDWLPRAPDDSSFGPKPAPLIDRHYLLNEKFADSWRVTNVTSLFQYAAGTGTMDFTDTNWPAPPGGSCTSTSLPGDVPKVKRQQLDLAKRVCSQINNNAILADCLLDVSIMGESAAKVHYEADAAQN